MVPLFDDQTLSWQPKIATKEFNAVSFWSATLDGYFIGGSFFLHIRCTSLAHYNLCNRIEAFVAIFWTYTAAAQKMQGKWCGMEICSVPSDSIGQWTGDPFLFAFRLKIGKFIYYFQIGNLFKFWITLQTGYQIA